VFGIEQAGIEVIVLITPEIEHAHTVGEQLT
jgi:hypothetical protein